MMKLREYQARAHETSHNTTIGNSLVLYPVLGLLGEAGELANKVKKLHRDAEGQMSGFYYEAIIDEAGDVLWYIAELCTQLGVDLDRVAALNLNKLADRAARGVIGGSGDQR